MGNFIICQSRLNTLQDDQFPLLLPLSQEEALESDEWFVGKISRAQAEQLVSGEGLPTGTFLIRERETNPLEYALTMKAKDGVKHYKINRLNGNEGFFITSRITFPSLDELVRYYIEKADGLCNQLTLY